LEIELNFPRSAVNGCEALPSFNVESGPRDFFERRGYVKINGSSRGTSKSEVVYQYTSHKEIEDLYDIR
jgi:predicted acyl esterase